jgi:hypothetical protein
MDFTNRSVRESCDQGLSAIHTDGSYHAITQRYEQF